jgi:hypothetical protein
MRLFPTTTSADLEGGTERRTPAKGPENRLYFNDIVTIGRQHREAVAPPDPADRGFQADAAHMACRPADRAAGVGRERQGCDARHERCRRAAARAARAQRRIPGIAGRAEQAIVGVSGKRQLRRVGLAQDHRPGRTQMKAVEQAAGSLNVQLQVSEVRTPSDFDGAFASASRRGAEAVLMLSSPLIAPNVQILADLAVRHSLPAITLFPDFARAGGLLAYGPNLLDMYRQIGVMAGKVLQGAKPAEMPVERPAKFELVLNLRTAKTLAISIPTSILLRADEVIE